MRSSIIWQFILLIINPSRLKNIYVPESLKAAHEKAKTDAPTTPESFHIGNIDRIRRGLFISLLLVIGISIIAILCGNAYSSYIGPMSKRALMVFQDVGIGVLLWATLAKQGWVIQTLEGNSLPEMLDNLVFRTMYMVGSFILVLSVSMQSTPQNVNSGSNTVALSLQDECARQAERVFKSKTFATDQLSYFMDHYDPKRGICFVQVETQQVAAKDSKVTHEILISDAFERREYATYVSITDQTKSYQEASPTTCWATLPTGSVKHCHSLSEFEAMTLPDMRK
jgi:hypothetical protein